MATSDKKSPILASIDKYQATWLSALASRSTRSEKVNTRKMFVELNDQLPEDFDPSQIDGRLCAGGNLITVFGRAFVNPKDKHVQETNLVAQAIRSILIANPDATNIYVGDISQKIDLAEQDIADVLESMAGFMGGGYFHNSGTNYGLSGWQSIRIDDELLRKFIQFESIEALLKKRILDPMKPSERYGLMLQISEKMVREKTLNQIKLFFHTCQIPQDETLPSLGKAKYVETVLRDLPDSQIEMVATELGVLQTVHVGTTVFSNIPKPEEPTKRLRVFICHASEDKVAALALHKRLTDDNIEAWIDAKDLLPGQDWHHEIKKAVRGADVVFVCLSKKSNKRGFVQREIKYSLDVADEQPEGSIFIIPVRFEDCEVPDRLSTWQWVNYYEDDGYERIVRALKLRAEELAALPSN